MTSKGVSSRSPFSCMLLGFNIVDQAILFGIIHILANFGLVIMDTGFFVKAFSAAPQAVVPGYITGGIAYFAIP